MSPSSPSTYILLNAVLTFLADSSGASTSAAAPSDMGEQSKSLSGSEIGLTHNVGGSGATAVVHVFGRAD